MGYVLSEESKDIVQLAKDFAEKEVAPVCAEYDKNGEFPMDIYQKAFDLGFHALEIPEEYGGSGLEYRCSSYRTGIKTSVDVW